MNESQIESLFEIIDENKVNKLTKDENKIIKSKNLNSMKKLNGITNRKVNKYILKINFK